MKVFERFQVLLSKVLGGICVVVFAVLVIDVLFGAFATQVLEDGRAWTDPLARLLLVWLAIFGGVLAYAGDRHLGVDILVSRFDAGTRRWALAIGHGFVFAFALSVLLIGGIALFVDRWQSGQMLAGLGVSRAWFYLALPVGGALILPLAVEKILACFAKPVEGEEAV